MCWACLRVTLPLQRRSSGVGQWLGRQDGRPRGGVRGNGIRAVTKWAVAMDYQPDNPAGDPLGQALGRQQAVVQQPPLGTWGGGFSMTPQLKTAHFWGGRLGRCGRSPGDARRAFWAGRRGRSGRRPSPDGRRGHVGGGVTTSPTDGVGRTRPAVDERIRRTSGWSRKVAERG